MKHLGSGAVAQKAEGIIFTCGALAQRRSSSCPFHLLLLLLPKFQNEFLKALKAKFNMESYAIWVKNFKSEDRFDLRGHSEAQIADFNFTLKNPDGFLIFCHRVSIAKIIKTMAKTASKKLLEKIRLLSQFSSSVNEFQKGQITVNHGIQIESKTRCPPSISCRRSIRSGPCYIFRACLANKLHFIDVVRNVKYILDLSVTR